MIETCLGPQFQTGPDCPPTSSQVVRVRSLRSHALMMFFETLFDFPKIVNPYPLAFMLLAIAFNREQALRCSAKSDGGQARACSRRERVAASVLPPRWG